MGNHDEFASGVYCLVVDLCLGVFWAHATPTVGAARVDITPAPTPHSSWEGMGPARRDSSEFTITFIACHRAQRWYQQQSTGVGAREYAHPRMGRAFATDY